MQTHPEYIGEASEPEVTRHVSVKHCKSCWREDVHKPARFNPIVYGGLFVLSFGLIVALNPSRCVCCGTMRVL